MPPQHLALTFAIHLVVQFYQKCMVSNLNVRLIKLRSSIVVDKQAIVQHILLSSHVKSCINHS